MPGPRLQVTIDCRDPQRLVAFWCAALGYVPEPPPGGRSTWVDHWRATGIPEEELIGAGEEPESIVDPDGVRPRIWFQVVPEVKTVKNRVHLDIDVTDGRSAPLADRQRQVDTEVRRLEELGARVLGSHAPEGADYYAVTMADPEGNEFCLS